MRLLIIAIAAALSALWLFMDAGFARTVAAEPGDAAAAGARDAAAAGARDAAAAGAVVYAGPIPAECLAFFDRDTLVHRVLPYVLASRRPFFDVVDDAYLGRLINNTSGPETSSRTEHALVGEALVSTLLQSTPTCIRINTEHRAASPHGFIFYSRPRDAKKPHVYDAFRVAIAPHAALYLFDFERFRVSKMNAVVDGFRDKIPDESLRCLVFDTVRKLQWHANKVRFAAAVLRRERKINFSAFFDVSRLIDGKKHRRRQSGQKDALEEEGQKRAAG